MVKNDIIYNARLLRIELINVRGLNSSCSLKKKYRYEPPIERCLSFPLVNRFSYRSLTFIVAKEEGGRNDLLLVHSH